MERSSRALVAALWPLTVGHLLAMLVVILPFTLLVALVQWQRPTQIGASLLVIGFGILRFVNRRHPRVLARIGIDGELETIETANWVPKFTLPTRAFTGQQAISS